MLKTLLEKKSPDFIIGIHVALGMLCALSGLFFVLWFLYFVLSSVNYLNTGKAKDRAVKLTIFVTYLASLELLGRFSRTWNYGFPYEYGKYVVFIGISVGLLLFNVRKGIIGLLLFFLLLPALIVNRAVELKFNMLVFNGMGPAALALGVLLFSNVKVTKHDIKQILLFLFYPCVSALAYTLIKNPDLTSYKFELGANFDTAGGFGSNQVSTILGLGMFLCLVFWVNKWRIFRNKNIPIVLGLLFAFQAFLTFSRGGLIGGVIAILVLVYCLNSSGAKLKKRYNIQNTLKYIIPIAITLLFSFQVVDQITGGVLTLRYQGHTNATTKGYKEIDADTFTSGRFGMMEEDLMIWNDNFLFGVGLGSSRYLRETHTAVSHIELSRLLAEHGMFGLLYFLIVVFVGIRTYFKNRRKNMKYQGVLVALFVLGLYTSFHAATRTFVTPLLIGLSMLDFKEGYESE